MCLFWKALGVCICKWAIAIWVGMITLFHIKKTRCSLQKTWKKYVHIWVLASGIGQNELKNLCISDVGENPTLCIPKHHRCHHSAGCFMLEAWKLAVLSQPLSQLYKKKGFGTRCQCHNLVLDDSHWCPQSVKLQKGPTSA